MFILIIASFMAVSILFYAGVSGTASLFNIKAPSQLCYPLGVVVLLLSLIIASDLQEFGGKENIYSTQFTFPSK